MSVTAGSPLGSSALYGSLTLWKPETLALFPPHVGERVGVQIADSPFQGPGTQGGGAASGGCLLHSIFSTTAPDFDKSQWLSEKFKLGLDFPNVGAGDGGQWA